MTVPGSDTPVSRDAAVAQLVTSGRTYVAAFGPLTDAQWTWAPDHRTWSASQIAEHLVLMDETAAQLLGERFNLLEALSFTDEKRVRKDAMIPIATVDRQTRIEAPERIRPTGRFANRAACVAAFTAARDALVTVVRTSSVDYRERGRAHPLLGMFDGVQWMIFVVAHTSRHLAQLAELRAQPGFPAP